MEPNDRRIKFEIDDNIIINPEYPFDRALQNQTGRIIELPNKNHPDEYLVKLDGGITKNVLLAGKLVLVNKNFVIIKPFNKF